MNVAIIGLEHMGMGKNLVRAGHRVTAFDLSRDAMQAAAEAGTATAASGREAVGDFAGQDFSGIINYLAYENTNEETP
ncbi:NAD(P)-binding domain-containing protein [Thiobacillus sp.]|uniref:NAD(P)-binding domain-containing protein n=1 Tax=Thiobacillus sp. TaxID=924 RepID=UPI0025EB1A70|nr:NAD(P)-binding domain-containing protein [Thiobacillus sp.]